MNGKIPVTLLQSFIETVEKIGVTKAQTILTQAAKYDSYTIDSFIVVQIIQNSVCKEFQITTNDLLNNKSQYGIRPDATRIFVFLLKDILKYGWRELKSNNIITIAKSTYPGQINYIKNLDPKLKFQKTLLDRIDKIKQDITNELKVQNIIK